MLKKTESCTLTNNVTDILADLNKNKGNLDSKNPGVRQLQSMFREKEIQATVAGLVIDDALTPWENSQFEQLALDRLEGRNPRARIEAASAQAARVCRPEELTRSSLFRD